MLILPYRVIVLVNVPTLWIASDVLAGGVVVVVIADDGIPKVKWISN